MVRMNISVFGLGYVGSVVAACMAELGHTVVGVDIHPAKVEAMRQGLPPVKEVGLGSLVARNQEAGRLHVTTDTIEAVMLTDVSLIAVGTPSRPNGSVDLAAVERCIESIAAVLQHKPGPHTVIIRSTVPPGTSERLLALGAKLSGRRLGADLLGGMNPEFLREGNAVADFFEPELIILGADDEQSAAVMREMYAGIEGAKVRHVSMRLAEFMKYASNTFHALKVAFANEIGRVGEALGVDGGEAMALVCDDKKLNISSKYLNPGFAFGGSCLPKDVRAVNRLAYEHDVPVPLLASLLPSNQMHILQALKQVEHSGARRIGLLGLTFKAQTDDLRESPALALASMLRDAGYQLSLHDCNFHPSQLIGASRVYLERTLPEIERYWHDEACTVVDASDLVLIANDETAYRRALANAQVTVLDLCRCGIQTSVYA